MNPKVLTANLSWFLYSAARARIWKRAAKDVEAAQERFLLKTLSNNVETSFGQDHSFGRIDSVASYQAVVPIQTYEDVWQYVERIANGETGVLTTEPVQRFGVSSGSTQASKLVPYTQSLITDFQQGIDPWMYFLMREYPRVLTGKTYWSVTPVGEKKKRSLAGIPIGFDDERSYFGSFTRWVLDTVMATPPELALIQDMDVFRYATLRFLLQEKSLSWVSIWNPTFVTLFLDPLEKWFDQLVEDVKTGSMSVDPGVGPEVDALVRQRLKRSPKRALELSLLRGKKGAELYQSIWPNLQLISCWAHASAREAVKCLEDYFPDVAIQPKGLIATEAFVSFPFQGESSALSITSHFFEFEEIETQTILLAHQLVVGAKYSVIVTTGGGLYRYRLNDMIEVLGFESQCPLIRFVGKQDKVVDICGEKLNEQFVSEVVARIISRRCLNPNFWMMAPVRLPEQSAFYALFVQLGTGNTCDNVFENLDREIDQAFRENYHYDYCRRLGQLGACQVFLIDPGHGTSQTYLTTCNRFGQRLGDIKPVVLHPYQQWHREFQGRFVP